MIRARLPQPAAQRTEEPARPKVRSSSVARSPRSARDPRFMRTVDRLQRTAARRLPARGLEAPPPAVDRRVDRQAHRSPALDHRFSAVLDVQRMPQGAVPVSSPHDPAEREATAVAQQVVTMPEPAPDPDAQREVEQARQTDAAWAPAQGRGRPPGPPARLPLAVPLAGAHGPGLGYASRAVMAEIAAAGPDGRPLPTSVRRFMEPRFRADFGGVRVHTGEQAARLSRQLSAHAFTVGGQVFFGRDRFQPESHAGRALIAHELTHTIQQGAAVQQAPVIERAALPDVSSTAQPHVQRLGLDTVLDKLADLANGIPGFRMFTIVLGVNPINGSTVDRSAANILRAIVEFLPGGGLITQALDKYGVFDKVGGWIEGQLASLGLSGEALKDALMRFLRSLGVTDLLDPGGVWERAKAIFTTPIERIISFVKSLAGQVLKFIKDAILRPLAELAAQTPAWDLLIAVLGRNPITGDPVPRTAETMIGGFMKLIGQEEIWANIKKGNAVARAWAWFQGALSGLMGFVQELPGLFLQALQSLEIADIIVLPLAFVKVGRVFSGFFQRFVSWAGDTIWDLLEIVFSVVAPAVIGYVKKAASAFKTILKNPIGFVKNLIAAGKLGLSQFVRNFVTHLKAALIGWLTGSLAGAGLYIPQALSLPEIGRFVLSLLGITWEKIRGKLVKYLGEPAVKALETGFDILVTLVKKGPAAAWELIKQRLTDLKDMVIQAIIGFVKDKIVTAAVTKLLSMLSPVGAFIQAIIGIYNTAMFFVERMRQIAAVAAAVIDSISAIANGVIAAAASKVEKTLAGLLTLAISFLARIAGLGKVSDAVVNFLKMVQGRVDGAIDAGVKFLVDKGKAFLKTMFGSGTPGKDKPKDPRFREKAKADVASRIKGKLALSQVQGIITTIYAKYQNDGLKGIIVKREGKSNQYEADIIASKIKASNAEAEFEINVSDLDLAWPRTIATAVLAAGSKRTSFGPHRNDGTHHAEENLIPDLKNNWSAVAKPKASGVTNQLTVSITRSPCGNAPKAHDCAKQLADFLAGRRQNYLVEMNLRVASIYGGKTRKASREAIQMLAKRGVTFTAWDIVKELGDDTGDVPADTITKLQSRIDTAKQALPEIVKAGSDS